MNKKRAVFLLGVMDRCGEKNGGPPLSSTSIDLITEIEEIHNLEAHIVFSVYDRAFAGKEKNVRLKHIKAERDRVVEEIAAIGPDITFCWGRTALSCALNRGSVTLDSIRWTDIRVPDIDGPLYVCDGLSRLAAQSGIAKWIKLSISNALLGVSGTTWGDYTVMLPKDNVVPLQDLMTQYINEPVGFTYEWDTCPPELNHLPEGTPVGFDLETYQGLDPWQGGARIRMAMVSVEPGRAWVVQCTQDSGMPQWLLDLLASPRYVKCGSNIAFDMKWCDRFGIEVNNVWDTSVAEHIIDENDPNTGLKWLSLRYLPRLGDYARAHHELVKVRGGWEHVRDDEQYLYAAADAEASVASALEQRKVLLGGGLARPTNLSMELYPILAKMQSAGTCVDHGVIKQLESAYKKHLLVLRKRICAVLGPINPASPDQLAKALVANIPGINLSERILTQWWMGKYKDDDDKVSTQKSILERESSRHPIIATVLEFRKWNKMYGTYIKGVLEKHLVYHDGNYFVHPSFNQNRVDTHRLSSSNPNLQNIPREPGENDPPELNVKQMFCSRFKGGHIMEADFGQAELRVAAMLSGDSNMLSTFLNDEDLHLKTAVAVFHTDPELITKEQRSAAKTINFGIIYGMGSFALGRATNTTTEQARGFKKAYFAAYPRLEQHIKEVHDALKEALEVEAPFGFVRHFVNPPEKLTGDKDRWNQQEAFRIMRQGYNMLIQNTAACITYVAVIEADLQFRNLGLKSIMFGTVHDSILVDVYPGEERKVAKVLMDAMENPPTVDYGVELTVPMVCDLEMGTHWGNKKEFVLDE